MPSAIILDILAILALMALMVSPPPSSLSSSSIADLNQTEIAAKEIIDAYQNPIVNILANEL